MLPIQLLSQTIKIIRSGGTPSQIAGGFVLGMLIGLLPSFFNPVVLLVVLAIFLIDVNIGSAVLAYALSSFLAYLLDPFFHSLGFFLLVDVRFLQGFWTALYNMPFLPLTGFNNTVFLGSLVSGLVLFVPVYLAIKKFIVLYREKYEPRVQNWKWMKLLKGSKLYQWYDRLKFLGD